MAKQPKPSEIFFPLKGWNTNKALNSVADGFSDDLLNVVPIGRDNRMRGAVRQGVVKSDPTQLANKPILLFEQVVRALDPAVTGVPGVYREPNTIIVCDGDIYCMPTLITPALATNGNNVLTNTTEIKPQCALTSTFVYFVDGHHPLITLDMSTRTVGTLTLSAGTETATSLGKYQCACMWRGRLVLANSIDNPQNYVMSRQGDPTDFDYAQQDPSAAFAGNGTDAGVATIGNPINLVAPWTTDRLVIGTDRTVHLVEGDPAAGGQVLLITDSVGTVGPNAWAMDTEGNFYFIGTGGLYKIESGSHSPVNIAADTILDYFAGSDRDGTYWQLAWDRDNNGLWIMQTTVTSGACVHLFYSNATRGFFPVQFPNNFGPTAIKVMDGDFPHDRQIVLGGRDGYYRVLSPSAVDDDGTTITNYVRIGPIRPAGELNEAVLEYADIVLGDVPGVVPGGTLTLSSWGVSLDVQVGKDAYTAINSTAKLSTTFTDAQRRKRMLQRVRGGTFYFKLTGTASKYWSFEKLLAMFVDGGMQRKYDG